MTAPSIQFSPYSAPRPPIGMMCQMSLGFLVTSAVVLAAQIPGLHDVAVPIVLSAASWLLFLIGVSMLAHVGPFAWRVFRLVASRELLAELVVGGMLEFVFVYDHTPMRALAIFTSLLVVFMLDVALLIAFTVARYQEID